MGRPQVERVTVSCAACGKDIEKRKTDAERNVSQRFFCSRECLNEVGAKPRKRQEKTCEQCGELFYPRWAAGDPARFCSRSCKDQWHGRNGVMRECEVCGKEFRLPPSRAKSEAARFCSKACEGRAAIKRPLDRMHNGRPVRLNSHGYPWVYEPDHPNADRTGWTPEHRLIAERALERTLGPDDHVHHINGDKADNRPKNLAVMTHLEHAAVTGRENQKRLREWKEYRKRYGPLT